MRHNTTAPKLILLSQMLLINSLAVKMMVNESKFTSIKMNKRKIFRGIVAPLLFGAINILYERCGDLEEGSDRAVVQRI